MIPFNSPSKRGSSPRGNRSKKSKANLVADDLMAELAGTSKEIDEFQVDIYPEEEESEEEVVVKNADGTPMDVQIGCLPSLIRTDDTGQIVQIEIIDKNPQKKPTKVDVIQLNSLPDLDSIEPQPGPECSTSTASPVVEEYALTDNDKPSKDRPKSQKKTHPKSKFKSMGMLPVANFEDS